MSKKVIVNAPEYPHYHKKIMYILWSTDYEKDNGEKKTFYMLAKKKKQVIADLYLGEKQVIKL